MKNKIRTASVAVAVLGAAGTIVATTAAAPAQAAAPMKHVVFRAWGAPDRAMVDVDGNNDIKMRRSLPYRHAESERSGWSFWPMLTVQSEGLQHVGCSITVNGVLRARDVSNYGYAFCSVG